MDHQWDPEQMLGLSGDGRCVGDAATTGRKCCNPINKLNRRFFKNTIAELSSQPLSVILLRPKLERLAYHGLCLRYHQNQVDDMVKRWIRKIQDLLKIGRAHV